MAVPQAPSPRMTIAVRMSKRLAASINPSRLAATRSGAREYSRAPLRVAAKRGTAFIIVPASATSQPRR